MVAETDGQRVDQPEHFRDRLLRALGDAVDGTPEQRMALIQTVAYGVAHPAQLDEGTRDIVRDLMTHLVAGVKMGLSAAPGSPEIRDLRRAVALVEGHHYKVAGLLKALERSPAQLPPFAIDGQAACLAAIQDVADIAHDVSKTTGGDGDMLAFGALISDSMQDIVLGLHAARHGYPRPALAHCRSVDEALDLLTLFRQDKAARDLWLSGDNDRILKELRASKVRSKLGRGGKDLPYMFYSALGTHPTIQSVLNRGVVVSGAEAESARLEILMAGTWRPDALIPAYMGLCFQSDQLLLEAIAWSQHLKAGLEENWKRLAESHTRRGDFLRIHCAPWMLAGGIVTEAKLAELSEAWGEPDALSDEDNEKDTG